MYEDSAALCTFHSVYSLVVFSSDIFGSPSIYLVGICLDLGLQFSLQLQRN